MSRETGSSSSKGAAGSVRDVTEGARLQFEREKFLELYRLSLDSYHIEMERSASMDRKASGYVAVLTFLIGGVGVLGKWLADSLLPPDGPLSWMTLGSCLGLLVTLVVAWFFVFESFRLRYLRVMNVDGAMLDLFRERTAITVYHALTKRLHGMTSTNAASTDRKALALHRGHVAIRIACFLFVALVICYAGRAWTAGHERSYGMSEKDVTAKGDDGAGKAEKRDESREALSKLLAEELDETVEAPEGKLFAFAEKLPDESKMVEESTADTTEDCGDDEGTDSKRED